MDKEAFVRFENKEMKLQKTNLTGVPNENTHNGTSPSVLSSFLFILIFSVIPPNTYYFHKRVD